MPNAVPQSAVAHDALSCTPSQNPNVGAEVGDAVGNSDGAAVGDADGALDGCAVGAAVGVAEGDAVGDAVGVAVGDAEGVAVGLVVGIRVGDAVGGAVPHWPHSARHTVSNPIPEGHPMYSFRRQNSESRVPKQLRHLCHHGRLSSSR